MTSDAVDVFISYSHQDEALRKALDSHLKILERQGYIAAWHDRKIAPGAEWDAEISTYLEQADLILLLVSADFLASDYCWNIEIDRAIKRHEDGEAIVVPIILRPTDWEEAPFSKLQAMPTNAQPVVTWASQDQAFADITTGLRQRAKQLIAARRQQQDQGQRQAALAQYRQKLWQYLDDGQLSFIEQENLRDLAEALGLDVNEAKAINTQALQQRQDYDKKLSRYRETFERALDHEFPLSAETQAALKERQQLLKLKDTDVQQVEATALKEKAAAAEQSQPSATASPATEAPVEANELAELIGNGVTLELVRIPGGRFWMGSPENEAERLDREGPQHSVTVPEFWLGKYPVTQTQWSEVAALPKVRIDLQPFPSHFKGDNRPVEQVNWFEAVEFCERLSRATGRTYRLPSEAEWEYACRAGTTTPFYFGETITTDLANYDGNYTYGNGPKGVYRKQTTDVGSFPPNAFGLYDMHGNVWEWCADHWHSNYEGAPTDGSAWLSNDNSSNRLLRGGSWRALPRYCRSANRLNNLPDFRNSRIGFRVVCASARALP
jgi:formylglycine-generating enzyme required for sulfatase activity